MYQMYTDAATRERDGRQSTGGILIVHAGVQTPIKIELAAHDNHTAEFEACKAGFERLIALVSDDDRSGEVVIYHTDSKIVADSLNKQYAKHYQPFVDSILALQAQFAMVVNQWVPEAQNMGAHTLAQQALHHFK